MFSDWSDWSDRSEVLSCIFRYFVRGSLPKANRALGGRKREKGVFFSLWRRFSDWSDPSDWSERSDGRRFFEGEEVRICFSEGEMGLKNKEKSRKQAAAEHSPSWGRWRGLCRVCCFSIPVRSNGHDAAFYWEAFATYVERVEGIGTIGATLEAVLVGFSELFAAFVLFAVVHARALDGNEQILVVGFVEVGHEARLSGKAAIDEQVFFDVAHGRTEIHRDDRPAAALEFVFDDPFEVFVVDGVVRAAGGGVEIEHNGFLGEMFVVLAEVAHEFGEFSRISRRRTSPH